MKQRHVTIGPEFFQKAKQDYGNWHWAVVREFLQNCIDCGSSNIDIAISEEESGQTIMTVENDGRPMSEKTLIEKLFALGASGKDFTEGAVGGFGKAKEILYFCHLKYEIWSGSQYIVGSGADYQHSNKSEPYVGGTKSRIVMEGLQLEDLQNMMKKFCRYAQFSGTISLNGTPLDTCLNKGSRRREFDFGTVYTNKSTENTMVVRIGGIPMFTQWASVDRCVVVELSGISSEVLTGNRDGLIDPYREVLSSFTTELAVDKRSALKARQPRYVRFAGDRMSHVSVNKEDLVLSVVDIVGLEGNIPDVEGIDVGEGEEVNEPSFHEGRHASAPSGVLAAALVETPETVATLGHEFIIKNETDLVVPRYYRPDQQEFSSHSRKLVRMWGRLILELHRMFDYEAEFAVGFIFDDLTEAEYEEDRFGKVYYLNPAKIVEQKGSYSKSFKKRFKLTERNRILSIAAHEFVHGLGFGYHDEAYAGKLTDLMAKIMDERKRFNWCFR